MFEYYCGVGKLDVVCERLQYFTSTSSCVWLSNGSGLCVPFSGQSETVTYHNPCSVQLSSGPVAGAVSQNCVCRSWPPGALKQHRFSTAVVLWQLNCGIGQLSTKSPITLWPLPPPRNTWLAPKATLLSVRREGMVVDSATLGSAEAAALCTPSFAAWTKESTIAGMSTTTVLVLWRGATSFFRVDPPVTAALDSTPSRCSR
jgi:hypothetical protein